MGFETQLTDLHGEIKSYVERQRGLQQQVDAIDARLQGRPGTFISGKGLDDILRENDSVAKLLRDKKGSAVIRLEGRDANLIETKTVITETATGSGLAAAGVSTTGVMPIDRSPGITPEARYNLRVRDVLYSRPTKATIVDFVKVSAGPSIASPVVEASTKPENAVTFTSSSERVRTLATWIPATRQVLDDFAELRSYLDGALSYAVNKVEEIELLSGDGTGEHLHGLIPQATSFSSGSLGTSWQRLDVIANAVAQIAAAAEMEPTFIIVNTADWWKLRLTKDGQNRYILGDPQSGAGVPQIWGISVVPSTSITAGTFLVGNGSAAAVEIADRMETTIEISTEHADYFTKNMVAIRAEKRLALVVKRPAAFVTGSFTTSPA